jgi:hypothetical protein
LHPGNEIIKHDDGDLMVEFSQAMPADPNSEKKDQVGHILARKFGAPAEVVNFMAQNASINMGEFRTIESHLASLADQGVMVNVFVCDVSLPLAEGQHVSEVRPDFRVVQWVESYPPDGKQYEWQYILPNTLPSDQTKDDAGRRQRTSFIIPPTVLPWDDGQTILPKGSFAKLSSR